MMADTLRNRRAESALADAIIQCLYSAPPDHWSAANVLLALLTQEIAFLPDALRERMMADIEGGALRTRLGYLEAPRARAGVPFLVRPQPWSRRPRSRRWSISRPPKRSVSQFRPRSCCAPTR